LVENNDLTSEVQLVFNWSQMLSNDLTGGTQIISYNVQWDYGTNGEQWESLAGFTSNFIGDEYRATASVEAGQVY
jgi:hypothetical protein